MNEAVFLKIVVGLVLMYLAVADAFIIYWIYRNWRKNSGSK